MTRRTATPVVLVAIVLLSFNLRPTAVSVGAVLDDIRDGLHMSGTEAGLLTSLPVLAFAIFGALAPWAARRFGPHRVTLAALLGVVAGLLGRATTHHTSLFLVFSMLALAGMAMANVLLPSLVRRHFPDRIGSVTAIYTTALAIGLSSAFVFTVPIAHAFDSWRAGIGAWAIVGVLAALPWLAMVRDDDPVATADRRAGDVRFGDVARTRLGWAMAVFFGLQSLEAYAVFGWFASLWRDAGFGDTAAGVLVGVVAGMSIPLSFVAPRLIDRARDPRRLISAIILTYPVAYGGLAIAPHSLAIVWAVVLGVALTTFPIALVLIGLRTRTPEGTAALSGFTQSLGYLIAAAGPFGVGVLHDATDGWLLPLAVLAALSVPLLALGLYVGRPAILEDQLAPAVPAS